MTRTLALASVFVSAFLLFLLEPMVGKMLLPAFGGSPAVWGTCLMFFQGLLLLGYGFGHLLSGLSARRALVLHGVALALPALVLPFAVHGLHPPAPGAWPVPMLLLALASTAGLPFFALSTNTSLVQHWYARRLGHQPWFLYAASNAGSLMALAAYPLFFERVLGLRAQSVFLAFGYALFVVLTVGTAAVLRVDRLVPVARHPGRGSGSAAPIPLRRCLRWTALSAGGSLLLLAATMHVSAEVAAVPLLWVLPLGLYLLTFVLAFLPGLPFPRRALTVVALLFVTLGLFGARVEVRQPFLLSLAVAMGALLTGGWLCHGDLAQDRPPAEQLTAYYLWIAVGGFLGGVLGSLVAPLVFESVAEWPLALAGVALVAATGDGGAELAAAVRKRRFWLVPALQAAALAGAALWRRSEAAGAPFSLLIPLLVLLSGIILSRVPGAFFSGAVLVAAVRLFGLDGGAKALEARRNFFGVVRVVETAGMRVMYHGQTIHGAQLVDPRSPEPLLYYTPEGPMGAAVRAEPDRARLGVVGMGTGSLARLAKAGQELTFYEIDPDVEPMARAWFDYLPQSQASVRTVLGDARLTLQQAPDGGFDLLVVDAFAGDAVPVHLLTEEAVRLYLAKAGPHGLVLVHVSNRYLALTPLLKGAAKSIGVRGAVISWEPIQEWLHPVTPEELRHWTTPSQVVALSADPARLAPLLAGGWNRLEESPGNGKLWTDDRSSLLDVMGKP